jgi:uncharacterized repeat protein (TIGR01451 family)
MPIKRLFTLACLLMPSAALAAERVVLASDVYVEREHRGRRVLEPPRALSSGDRLVFVLSYRNGGAKPASDLIITNPVPDGVAFAGVEDETAEVSVDGGLNWGKLGILSLRGADGVVRPSRAEDVTHVRWRIASAVPSGQGGELSFRAIAR